MQVSIRRRNTELALLILALIVGAGAVALVALARNSSRVDLAIPVVSVLVVCYVVAHMVMRKLAPHAAALILPIAAILNAIGLAAVYRLSPKGFGPTQVTWTVVGIACFIATLVLVRDVRVLSRYKYLLGFIGVGLLLLPVVVGEEINGAKLWIKVGAFSFQPGEIAKVCLVIFFAAYLAERKELLAIASRRLLGIHFPDVKHFGPLLVMWGLSLAVMFYGRDLGSSLLFFSIFLVMLYIATARVVYAAFGTLLFGLGAYVGYQQFAHVQERVQAWLHVFDADVVKNEGYQLAQS